MERWGLTEDRVRALDPDVDLRPHERLRALGPARRLPQLRPGRAGGQRAVAHQRPARRASRRAGACRTWTTRPRTTTPRRCSWRSSPAAAPARGTDIDVSAVEAGVELLGPDPARRRGERPHHPRRRLPDRQPPRAPRAAPHGVYPCRGRRPLGRDRGVRRRRVGGARAARSGRPAWARRRAVRDGRRAGSATRTSSTRTWPSGPRPRDRHEVMHRLQAAGVRAGAVQDARGRRRDTIRRSPHRGHVLRAGPPGDRRGPVRGHAVHSSTASAPDHWRSAPLLGEDNDYVFREILGHRRRRDRRPGDGGGDLSDRPETATADAVRRPAGGRARRRPGRAR